MLTTQMMNYKGQIKSKLGMGADVTVLNKLELTYKDEKDKDIAFVFQYNPGSLSIKKGVEWENVDGNQKDVQAKQFKNGNAKTVGIKDVLFDTTSIGNMSVYTNYIQALESMLMVRTFKTKKGKEVKRPPFITLKWGKSPYFFTCILKELDYEFTMFNKEGIPIRAKVELSFEEVVTQSSKKQAVKNQTKAKTYIVKTGDTLHGIANSQYKNPNKWKVIATANGIDDPMYIPAGTKLTLPVLT